MAARRKPWDQVEAYAKSVGADLSEVRSYYDITERGETIPWTPLVPDVPHWIQVQEDFTRDAAGLTR